MPRYGRVIKSNGGLFAVRLLSQNGIKEAAFSLLEETVYARGRGNLRRDGILVGDLVTLAEEGGDSEGNPTAIEAVLPRKNALIRPPMANLDLLFVTMAAAAPTPVPETVDKLIAIAEFNEIEPVVLVTKSDLAPARAEELCGIYRLAGFSTFSLGEGEGWDLPLLRDFIADACRGRISAVSGASGVGKSTLLNKLFPGLLLQTGEISLRIERGKNTTRCVELYPLSDAPDAGFLADTPGFTMLDFERFDFFGKEDLPLTFREFRPYIGECRYTKCSHTKEEGCAILAAVRSSHIPPSRHKSFCNLYEVLKKKTRW